jgi:hypothetical protein
MWVLSQDKLILLDISVFYIEDGKLFGATSSKAYCLGDYYDNSKAGFVLGKIYEQITSKAKTIYKMP